MHSQSCPAHCVGQEIRKTMLQTVLSIFLQKDRKQTLQRMLVDYLSKGQRLDLTDPQLIRILNNYESLSVAVERKKYKFPLRWSDWVVLAKFSRSAKNELEGRSMRYNSNYIQLRKRWSKELTNPTNAKS
jgi:hypothetical protein